jgi:hypothetical protein
MVFFVKTGIKCSFILYIAHALELHPKPNLFSNRKSHFSPLLHQFLDLPS